MGKEWYLLHECVRVVSAPGCVLELLHDARIEVVHARTLFLKNTCLSHANPISIRHQLEKRMNNLKTDFGPLVSKTQLHPRLRETPAHALTTAQCCFRPRDGSYFSMADLLSCGKVILR
eukprot:1654679-Rhodomonas_salina.1